MARGSLVSAKRSPTDPKATSNCCLPTSTAALIPPITCLRIVAGALTPSGRLIRARDPAAPSTVRALLPVGGRGEPCFDPVSNDPGSPGLPRPRPNSSSRPISDIQGSHGRYLCGRDDVPPPVRLRVRARSPRRDPQDPPNLVHCGKSETFQRFQGNYKLCVPQPFRIPKS